MTAVRLINTGSASCSTYLMGCHDSGAMSAMRRRYLLATRRRAWTPQRRYECDEASEEEDARRPATIVSSAVRWLPYACGRDTFRRMLASVDQASRGDRLRLRRSRYFRCSNDDALQHVARCAAGSSSTRARRLQDDAAAPFHERQITRAAVEQAAVWKSPIRWLKPTDYAAASVSSYGVSVVKGNGR